MPPTASATRPVRNKPAATAGARQPSPAILKTKSARSGAAEAHPTSPAYEELIGLVRAAGLLGSTASLLHWDQEALMPPRGIEHRSRQLAQLAKLTHTMATSSRIGELLDECLDDRNLTADPRSIPAVNLREIRRDYDRKTKLPAALVEEEAALASTGQVIWREARRESDFKAFQPHLEKIVDLLRRKAKAYGWPAGGEAWDALAEDYEPGASAAQIARVFTPLRQRLQALLDDLMSAKRPPRPKLIKLKLPVDEQKAFVRFVAESIGFEFERGRLDVSTHPFCGGSHCNDVRITSRYREDGMLDALGSVMHECGHGIYEQGLLERHIGTPMGEAVSLGIHESQSRMWENQVGRSRPFWKWLQPKMKKFFGSAVKAIDVDDAYAAANLVNPSFIRVEADEATYNMHVMIRFEIERAIIAGDLAVKDIPGVWNKKYKEYLGLTVPDDRRGCLQDVHWSGASMGYFPTYTLGNLYCAQFFEQALEAMPDLLKQFAHGEFDSLKEWLNRNIHAHGRRYRAAELCAKVTGKPVSADPLLRHLEGKLRPLYNV